MTEILKEAQEIELQPTAHLDLVVYITLKTLASPLPTSPVATTPSPALG